MDNRVFLSVLSTLASSVSSGNVTFTLTSYNVSPNVSFTISASGLQADTEIDLARKIYDGFVSYLTVNNCYYPLSPTPLFSGDLPAALFTVTRTDNILCIWSQCQYSLTVTTNQWQNKIKITPSPLFLTVAEARSYAILLGIALEDTNGTTLTDDQVIQLVQSASDQVTRFLNNNLVLSNYLHEAIGKTTGSIKLKKKPVWDYDAPRVRRTDIGSLSSTLINSGVSAFDIVRDLGILNYRCTNSLIDVCEPFEINNEIKITYRAGYMNIPDLVKEKTMQVMALILESGFTGGFKTLKGGSFELDTFDPLQQLKFLFAQLMFLKL